MDFSSINSQVGNYVCIKQFFEINLTLCKHLIAYMYLKYPDDQKKIEEQS